jgi:hypothetical protein
MDFIGAISRIHNLYRTVEKKPISGKGFGLYISRYESIKGPAMLYVILAPPTKKNFRGKHKDLEGAIDKSKNTGKLILPKDYLSIEEYLNSIFDQITVPRDQVLNQLGTLLAGLRLEFVPYQNMKLTFTNPKDIQIVVYDKDKDGQFGFYINIIELKEEGLYLAHERQINFIIQEIKNGKDPLTIKNLPPLRTGETALKAAAKKADAANPSGTSGTAGTISSSKRDQLRQILKERHDQQQIETEKKAETTIESFAPAAPKPEEKVKPAANIPLNPVQQIFFKSDASQDQHSSTPTPASVPTPTPISSPTPTPAPSINTAQPISNPQNPFQSNPLRPDTTQNPITPLGASSPPMANTGNPNVGAFSPFPQSQGISPFSQGGTQNTPILGGITAQPPTQPQDQNRETQFVHEQHKKELERLKEQLNGLEAHNQSLLLRLQTMTDENAKLIQEKDREINQYKQLFSKKDQEQAAYQALMDEYKKKEIELQNSYQHYRDLQEQMKFVNEQNQNSQDMIAKQQQIIDEISKKNANLDDIIERITQEKEEIAKEKDKIIEELKAGSIDKESAISDEFIELGEENEILAEKIETADKRIEELELENNELKGKLSAIEAELNSFDDEDLDVD